MSGASRLFSATSGFLQHFQSAIPKVVVTAETDSIADFDAGFLKRWRDEGFDVQYLPYGDPGKVKPFLDALKELDRGMGVGQHFVIICFGDAASTLLSCLQVNFALPRLRLALAYYPSALPEPSKTFPRELQVIIHLPRGPGNTDIDVARTPEILGIQGKRKKVSKKIPEGKGIGGLLSFKGFRGYVYEGLEVGFAERDLEECYDEGCADLAFGRDLEAVKGVFGVSGATMMEDVWETWWESLLKEGNADHALRGVADNASITYVPTLTGGRGKSELRAFYAECFLSSIPPSLDIELLSRTIGADKLVDELVVSFDHTQEMDWILPGLPPTNKHVEVAVVCIVAFQGGAMKQQNVYWDQASVLMQVGLLNPRAVPMSMKRQGVETLPIIGAESANELMDPGSEDKNVLIEGWWDDSDFEADSDGGSTVGGSESDDTDSTFGDDDVENEADVSEMDESQFGDNPDEAKSEAGHQEQAVKNVSKQTQDSPTPKRQVEGNSKQPKATAKTATPAKNPTPSKQALKQTPKSPTPKKTISNKPPRSTDTSTTTTPTKEHSGSKQTPNSSQPRKALDSTPTRSKPASAKTTPTAGGKAPTPKNT